MTESDKAVMQQALDVLTELQGSINSYNKNGPDWTHKDGTEVFEVSVLMDRQEAIDAVVVTLEAAIAQPEQQARTLLEDYDLQQSPEYHKGREDGRAKGYEVGYRYATERFAQPEQTPPVRQPLTDAKLIDMLVAVGDFDDETLIRFARAIEAAHGIAQPKDKP